MPFADNGGTRLYWRSDGLADKPPLLLLNSIGTEMGSWETTVPHLIPQFRVIRMDTRGHGASDSPTGDYDMATLAADARAVLDAAGVDKVLVCGVSLGGMMAMQLALDAPKRVSGLVLACTSPAMDSEAFEQRRRLVLDKGMAAVVETALGRFFAERFRRTHAAEVATIRDGLLSADVIGYAGCCAAIRDMQLSGRITKIACPTVVVGGRKDVSTPFDHHGAKIAAEIPGAVVQLLDAAHLAMVEAPLDFAAVVRTAFADQPSATTATEASAVLYDRGLKVRRQILGDAWVDRSLANRTELNGEFQAMITRVAWNEVWTRPGLDHRTRRLLVLAITAALGRWEEFRLHVRAGVEQDGFTPGELKETLMQTAVYAGVPAANTAFAEAAEVLAEIEG